MDREAVLAVLRAHRAELAAAGVAHAGVFGSVARGEANAASDVDILIAFAPGYVPSVFHYAGVRRRIAELLPAERVDVLDRDALRPAVRAEATRDAVYAF